MCCVSYGRRGTRRSDVPRGGYDFDTLADDLAALVDHLGLRDVTLAGHSMGTGEVTRYLARHSSEGRVARAALVSTITPYVGLGCGQPGGLPRGCLRCRRRPDNSRRARYWSAWPGAFFGTHLGNPVSAETIGWAVGEAMQTPMMAVLRTWHSIFHTDFRSDLRSFTVPTLIIHGTADQNAIPDLTGRPTADLVPSNTYKEYEGATHGLFVTHKDQLNADLLAFINSTSAAQGALG
jgi:non-heme chloroperoxidase